MYFSLSLWRNDNRSKLWPCSLFKALKAEAGFRETQRNSDIRIGVPVYVVVGWNAPWRWKTTSPKWFGAITVRKWQTYSLFPDLDENKTKQLPRCNHSHLTLPSSYTMQNAFRLWNGLVMLFSVYMGPGQMKNMKTNTATSIHFGY